MEQEHGTEGLPADESIDEVLAWLDWQATLPPHFMSRDEIIAQIDEGARQRRGVSGRRLARAQVTGRLRDWGEVADLVCLIDMLDDDDPFLLPPPRRQRAPR